MDLNLFISMLAIGFSITSFALSFWQTRRTATAQIRPVLVFVYASDGWKLRNIGEGPALNVVVAITWDGETWKTPVRVPALATNVDFDLHWIGHLNVRSLGAKYTDFQGRSYSSTSIDDLTTIFEKDILPKWERDAVTAHWTQPPA